MKYRSNPPKERIYYSNTDRHKNKIIIVTLTVKSNRVNVPLKTISFVLFCVIFGDDICYGNHVMVEP